MKKSWWCAGLLLTVGTGPAYAHSPVSGIEGFYTGLVHPFSTPSQALLMFGLGLLIGSFSNLKIGWQVSAFLAATVAGVILGDRSAQVEAAMFALAFVAFAWSALGPGKLPPVAIVLAAIGGFLIGLVSIPDSGLTRDRLVTMAGSLVGANVGLLYIYVTILSVRERYTWGWVGIALRVVAAWLGAISLLMLALHFAPGDAAL